MLRSFIAAAVTAIALCSAVTAEDQPHTEFRAAAEDTCEAILERSSGSDARDLCIQAFRLRYTKSKFPIEPELQEFCNKRASVEKTFQHRMDIVQQCLDLLDVEEDREYFKSKIALRQPRNRAPAEETCHALFNATTKRTWDECVQLLEMRYKHAKYPSDLMNYCNTRARRETATKVRMDQFLNVSPCLMIQTVESSSGPRCKRHSQCWSPLLKRQSDQVNKGRRLPLSVCEAQQADTAMHQAHALPYNVQSSRRRGRPSESLRSVERGGCVPHDGCWGALPARP